MKSGIVRTLSILLALLLALPCVGALAEQPAISRICKLNDQGEDVRQIQERLIALGYLEGEAGGVFDSATEKALLDFQSTNSLLKTGMADAITLGVLFSDSALEKDYWSKRWADDYDEEYAVVEEAAETGAYVYYAAEPSMAAAPMPMATAMPRSFSTEEYGYTAETGYTSAQTTQFSTFSVDVDTAAYAQVRSKILRGERVPADAIQVEQMLNYFSYDYAQPKAGEPFGVTMEMAECPWNENALLLLIGLQAEIIRDENRPDYNLVFLIDTSGSMYGSDRLDLVKRAFMLMLDELKPTDTVSIVAYASMDRVVIEGVPASEKTRIMDALNSLEAHGSTNGSAGLTRAYEIADRYAREGSVNRILLATDGDLNVGLTSEGDLARLVQEKKEAGVKLTVLGFGYGNYKDNKMEALALYGDGNYWYIDTIYEARKALVTEAGGTFLTVAEDVKLQLDFNPGKVAAFRLVGYEDRVMAAEDFANDKVEGGMIGSGHQVTALYEIIPASGDAGVDAPQSKYGTFVPGNSAEWFTLSIRAKVPGSETSDLYSYPWLPEAEPGEPTGNIRFAAAVAETALLLRDSAYKGSATFENVQALLKGCDTVAGDVYKEEFVYLVNLLQRQSELAR